MHWMILPLKRYTDFSGRSRRLEFWVYTLGRTIVVILLGTMVTTGLAETGQLITYGRFELGALFWVGSGLLGLFWLGTIIPTIAVWVRRLHDQDVRGWFYLIVFIPIIGWLLLLLTMCYKGTSGPNRFGEDPKGGTDAKVFE